MAHQYGLVLQLPTLLILRRSKTRSSTELESQGRREIPTDRHSPNNDKLVGSPFYTSVHLALLRLPSSSLLKPLQVSRIPQQSLACSCSQSPAWLPTYAYSSDCGIPSLCPRVSSSSLRSLKRTAHHRLVRSPMHIHNLFHTRRLFPNRFLSGPLLLAFSVIPPLINPTCAPI